MAGRTVLIVVGVLAVLGLGYAVYQLAPPSGPRVVLSDGDTAVGEEIATPLVGSVQVRRAGPGVVLLLALRDAKGRQVRSVYLSGGRQPDPPEVDILDADGKRRYSCTLAYG